MSAAAGPDEPATSDGRASMLPATLADGRYRVTGRLGIGGMGVVVRAEDVRLGREVAVKLLADNLALDDGARSRFLHEARAAAAVSDPRVVAVFDVGEEAGRPYLVMECVDGPSLADVLRTDGPLPPDEVLDVARDALAALGRAHAAGLLHRDVKPGNLLRAADGTTKVTDFGVALAVDGERLTRTGFVIGTVGYLAPERRRGAGASVRTDLWALGATLTELLTGSAPEDGGSDALARLPDVPPRLRELVLRLLVEHPDARPADAVAALELLAEDPLRSAAPTPPPPAPVGPRTSPLALTPEPGTAEVLAPGAGGARPHDDAGPARTPRGRRPARTAAVVGLFAAGAIGVAALAADGPEGSSTDATFEPVSVDPDDPAASVRELAERLREHSDR